MDAEVPIVDLRVLGRLVRAARIVAGYDSVADAAAAIKQKSGVAVTSRAIYGIERGEREITLTEMMGILLSYQPPGGSQFFAGSFRADLRELLREMGSVNGAS